MTHDVLRLLARHNVALVAVGEDGVRFYTAPPLLPDTSTLARKQAGLWSDTKGGRMRVARKMYAMRLGEVLPHRDIAVLRGIEGARAKETYKIVADRFGIPWHGRRYDRDHPDASDLPIRRSITLPAPLKARRPLRSPRRQLFHNSASSTKTPVRASCSTSPTSIVTASRCRRRSARLRPPAPSRRLGSNVSFAAPSGLCSADKE